MISNIIYDLIGIGVGPSNLSLAALSDELPNLKCLFIEANKSFVWHPGMMLPFSKLQTSFLKDLVTLVNPTSKHSFLSFLHTEGRLLQFLNRNKSGSYRKEFEYYFQYVSENLNNIIFNETVEDVSFDKNNFIISSSKNVYVSKHIVLGSGLIPTIPSFLGNTISKSFLHSSNYLHQKPNLHHKKVAIIGGGQSGAEVALDILSQENRPPSEIVWISSRNNLHLLEDTPFSNEFFTPAYSDYFFSLPYISKKINLQEQKYLSDGVTLSTLEELYDKVYYKKFIHKEPTINFKFGYLYENHKTHTKHETLYLRNKNNLIVEQMNTNIVILCTGYKYQFPSYLLSLKNRIHFDETNAPMINENYSVKWNGPAQNKIYIQNGTQLSRGIAEPNLSLIPWRNAKIINNVLGKTYYKIDHYDSLVVWQDIKKPVFEEAI